MRVINSVLGDATGGRWQVVMDYANALSELGHSVLTVAEKSKVGPDTHMPEGSGITLIRNSGHYDLMASLSAIRLLNAWKPDLIIVHCSRSLAVMKRASFGRIKIIGVSHSNNVRRMAKADAFFNISTHIERELRRYGADGKPAFLMPNMVHFDKSVSFAPKKWSYPPVIGAYGRLDKIKGFHNYVEALAILKRRGVAFQAVLGGSGVEEASLKEQVKNLGLCKLVTFNGWVYDVDDFLAGVDVLCIPALSDAFGLTPLTSAISSTPLVLSDATGHIDMFDDRSATYYDRENPAQLSDVLCDALQKKDKLTEKAKQAFYRVYSNYGAEQFKDRLEQAINQLS